MTAYFADFRRQHADGKLFWIFDSFDELPVIPDAGTGRGNPLAKSVAQLLFDFITVGAKQGAARGLIASRYERKPDLPAPLVTLIELQPFDDHRICEAFARNHDFPIALADDIFRPPGNLVPLARTPFYHALIIEFAINHQRLPATTAAAVRVLCHAAFDQSAAGDLEEPDEEIKGILELAENVAAYLFNSERYGLGCPLDLLKKTFPQPTFQDYVSRLERAKIARVGVSQDRIFTFSHRRMHEYFLVRYNVGHGIPFDIDWVTEDARERDSAVLHVELADADECQTIAEQCWKETQAAANLRYDDPEFYRGINCQRFLAEAFRTRRSAIERISAGIEAHIIGCLKGDDIIRAKLAAESIGLLSQVRLEQAIDLAVSGGDYWVRDTAIDAQVLAGTVGCGEGQHLESSCRYRSSGVHGRSRTPEVFLWPVALATRGLQSDREPRRGYQPLEPGLVDCGGACSLVGVLYRARSPFGAAANLCGFERTAREDEGAFARISPWRLSHPASVEKWRGRICRELRRNCSTRSASAQTISYILESVVLVISGCAVCSCGDSSSELACWSPFWGSSSAPWIGERAPGSILLDPPYGLHRRLCFSDTKSPGSVRNLDPSSIPGLCWLAASRQPGRSTVGGSWISSRRDRRGR